MAPKVIPAGPSDQVATVQDVGDDDDDKSIHHHHDHEHHHHHSHYERTVDEDGTVRERTVTEEVITEPPPIVAAAAAAVAVINPEGGGKKKNNKKKKKEKVVEEVDKTVDEVVIPATANPTVAEPIVAAPTLLPPATIASPAPSVRSLPVQATKTVTTVTKVIAPASRPPSVHESTLKAPSIRAPSRPASVVQPPAPTIIAPVIVEPLHLPVTAPVPPSPTPSHHSHKSHRSHHHPEVIVNVNVPTAPAPAPIAPGIVPLPVPIVEPKPVKAAAVPLPPSVLSVPPSPAGSVRSMRLPKILRNEPKYHPTYVQAIPEEALNKTTNVVEEQLGDEIVTKVVTTTTTSRRATTPPKTPSPVAQARIPTPPPGGYVVNDPSWYPPKPATKVPSVRAAPVAPPTPITPALPLPREGSPGRFVETTTTETITYPISLDTNAGVLGGPTTKGATGARTAALSDVNGPSSGTKAGLRPIPFSKSWWGVTSSSQVDYSALVRATYSPRRKFSLPATLPPHTEVPRAPAPTVVASAAPKTILTVSADLEKDSKGNEHYHARLRDHTGVVKTVDKVIPTDDKTLAPGDAISEAGEKRKDKETKKKKKDREKVKDKEKEIEEGVKDLVDELFEKDDKKEKKKDKEPVYRPLGGSGLPPPTSERQ